MAVREAIQNTSPDSRSLPAPVLGSPEAAGCCEPVIPAPLSAGDANRWARVFRALSDPTRLRILALLAAQDRPLCVCDIVAQFPLGQPTISHHLRILREAGLVTAERRGSWVYHSVAQRGLLEAWRAVAKLVP
ncbi:MAG: metalloregulator ArsR/SmtB family transcription factor [Bacillota bacterium]